MRGFVTVVIAGLVLSCLAILCMQCHARAQAPGDLQKIIQNQVKILEKLDTIESKLTVIKMRIGI